MTPSLTMHLVNPIKEKPLEEALAELEQAHSLLANRVTRFLDSWKTDSREFKAIDYKRTPVSILDGTESSLIGKPKESCAEVINIMATMERTIDAIEWIASKPCYSGYIVKCCHPATSSKPLNKNDEEEEDNDLVIVRPDGTTAILCEVTDVVSHRANTNGKERKDVKNLGCEEQVPEDGIERFICTSQEFGEALASKKRLWHKKCYKYEVQPTDAPSGTLLLRILPNN